MSKKKTIEEFLVEAKGIHGEKYDYSKVDYVNNLTKVCIICPEHGEFWQTPKAHICGNGCPKCARKLVGEKSRKSVDDFIRDAKNVHGDKYDYSRVNYVDCETEVCIICPEHGEFWQTPIRHLNSNGCPKCVELKKNSDKLMPSEEFIKRLNAIFGDKYGYERVNYKNTRAQVTLVCKKHGEFTRKASSLLAGYGCPLCKKEKTEQNHKNRELEKQILLEERKSRIECEKQEKLQRFINKAKTVHGDKYDYSMVKYEGNSQKVPIICSRHGVFYQTIANHLRGAGCPFCAREKVAESLSLNLKEFIEKAKKVHGDKYDYSKVNYINNHTKVIIGCKKHGDFLQTPAMHVSLGQGCPLCGTLSSKDELNIYNFLKEKYDGEIILREHSIIPPKELDIYIPKKNIAIEYNGLRWHSELFTKNKNSHLEKMELCKKQGISLIQIFEDEWTLHKEICKEKLLHLIELPSVKEKIFARKCSIKEIKYKEATAFLDKNHIQGSSRSTIFLGCFYNEKLIGVMSFLKESKDSNDWELNRFATDINYICCGVGGKLFKYFVRNYSPVEIKSFADRRWTINEDDNLYIKLGFTLESIVPPDYRYVTDKNSFKIRYHKFNFRKSILNKKYGLPLSMTEKEMAQKLHFYRIYDCGLIKYIWRKNDTSKK